MCGVDATTIPENRLVRTLHSRRKDPIDPKKKSRCTGEAKENCLLQKENNLNVLLFVVRENRTQDLYDLTHFGRQRELNRLRHPDLLMADADLIVFMACSASDKREIVIMTQA